MKYRNDIICKNIPKANSKTLYITLPCISGFKIIYYANSSLNQIYYKYT